jgi:hypothetical protein
MVERGIFLRPGTISNTAQKSSGATQRRMERLIYNERVTSKLKG